MWMHLSRGYFGASELEVNCLVIRRTEMHSALEIKGSSSLSVVRRDRAIFGSYDNPIASRFSVIALIKKESIHFGFHVKRV